MFKFTNLHNDLANVKFDAVSQALASSQTLVSSFRSIVGSLLSRLINNDALIKGQPNGPDLASFNIDDTVNQLQLLLEQYKLNMDALYDNNSLAFVKSGDDSDVRAIIAGMSASNLRMDVSQLHNHPWWISKFNPNLDECPIDFILNLTAYPKLKFYPLIQNVKAPALNTMYISDSNLNSGTLNILQDFWYLSTLPVGDRPVWMSIIPLLVSSKASHSSEPSFGKLGMSDYTFEISGDQWYLNAYLIQSYEVAMTSVSTFNIIHSCGILVVASKGTTSVQTKAWFKTTDLIESFNQTKSEAYRFNKTWQNLSLLNDLNFQPMSTINTPHMIYNRALDCYEPINLGYIIAQYFEQWRPKYGGDFNYVEYVQYIGNTLSGSDYSITGASPEAIPISSATIETDDGTVFTDLKGYIPSITGDVTQAMQGVIEDLSDYTYES